MAYVDVNFYDYNGTLRVFGVVAGLSGVASVRMYVSDGHGNTYQYRSTQIYTQREANILTSRYTQSPCYVLNVDTGRDAESGSPTQLNYWVKDPEETSAYGHYHVSFHFYNSSGTLLNSSVLKPTQTQGYDTWFQMHNSLTSPTISYDENTRQLTLSNVGKHRYFIELRRVNRWGTAKEAAIRDYAYSVNMQCLEGTMGGKYTEGHTVWMTDWNNPKDVVCRYRSPWMYRNLKVGILFDSGANYSASEKATYVGYVKYAFEQIKEAINSVCSRQVSFTYTEMDNSIYTTGDIDKSTEDIISTYGWGTDTDFEHIVRVGKKSTFTSEDYYWGGFWVCWAWSNYPEDGISTGMANIDTTYTSETVRHVFSEEIFQSLNIGCDNFTNPLSRHWDPHFCNPYDMYQQDPYNDDIQWDLEVLKFYYSEDMNGWSPIDFINNKDTKCVLWKDSSGGCTFDLSSLKGGKYYVSAWVADEGTYKPGGGTWSGQTHFNWDGGWDDCRYSNHTQTVIETSSRPDPFEWDTPKRKGQPYKVTAKEWNKFQQHIKVIAQYKEQVLTTTFEDVQPGQIFEASIYNNARKAIQELPNGTGSYIPQVSKKTQITADVNSSNQANNNINKIVDEINAVD